MNKFGAIRSKSSGGRSFASKGERDCYEYLKLLERAGEIDSIECQVVSTLTAEVKHTTDFKYFDLKIGESVYAEYKGLVTERWRIIKKLWKFYGPGRLRIYGGYGTRIRVTDEIIPADT